MDDDKSLARLLVADDDSDIIQVLKLGLQKKWILSWCIYQHRSTSKLHIKCKILLFSAVRHPNTQLSGIQIAKKVNEANPSVKVVLMTAFETKDNELSKVFPFTQVDGFIQGPIGIGDLTNKILSLIGATKRRI